MKTIIGLVAALGLFLGSVRLILGDSDGWSNIQSAGTLLVILYFFQVISLD